MIIVFCAIGFAFSLAMFFVGRWMRTSHAVIAQKFYWMPRFASTYFRIVGIFFMVMGTLGMILYAVMTLVHLI